MDQTGLVLICLLAVLAVAGAGLLLLLSLRMVFEEFSKGQVFIGGVLIVVALAFATGAGIRAAAELIKLLT